MTEAIKTHYPDCKKDDSCRCSARLNMPGGYMPMIKMAKAQMLVLYPKKQAI